MAEHGTIFDPQVCLVFQNYVDHPDAYNFTDSTLAPLKAALPTASAMFAKAIKTPGLKIVFGTDAVALAHGRNVEELVCRDAPFATRRLRRALCTAPFQQLSLPLTAG